MNRFGTCASMSLLVTALSIAPLPARAAGAESPGLASAESLYAAGDLIAAEKAFAALKSAKDDTLITLRRASLQLLRNDRAAARATLAPLLNRKVVPRTAQSLMAESYARDLDYPHAAPFERALGREAAARQLESFAGLQPYRYEGPARVTVPFVQTDPLPTIELKINGQGPFLFLIDTGAGQLVVDPVLADSLGCPRFGEFEGTFGGGKKRAVTTSRVASLGLGEATFHDLPAGLLDCSRFAAVAMGRRVWGILGTHVFMRVRATLDYPGSALVLERNAISTPGAAAPDSNRHTLPMWLAGDHFILARGTMGAGPEALWFVDTGLAGAAITAPRSTLEAAGIAVPDTSSGRSGVGGGGSMKVQMFPVERFAMGDVTANGLMGMFGPFPPTLERSFGYRIAGIVSHAFFRSWRVTFDFQAMQLVLEKRSTAGM